MWYVNLIDLIQSKIVIYFYVLITPAIDIEANISLLKCIVWLELHSVFIDSDMTIEFTDN